MNMAPIKNPKLTRKQTGTVPKITTTSCTPATPLIPTGVNAPKSSSSTKTPRSLSSGSSQKNTEIVAPTRRDLNDFNDYLLSVAESSTSTTSSKRSNNNDQSHTETLDSTCFELDNLNLHENQRYCWPVRPLPRRNSPNRDYGNSDIQPTISSSNNNSIHSINYSANSASGVNSQAIGVVIPTTPNSTLNDDNYAALIRSQPFHQAIAANFNSSNQQHHQQADITQTLANLDSELTWEQRLNFIQYFLSLTTKTLNKANDTRAHSVTSIHSASIPNTPTYEELQSKLEASSRNIQSIKEQQQQLVRMQQAAKDHLVEMENIRNARTQPTFFNQNGTAPPNYENIGQVQSDMTNLVNRMKDLTTFIQNQNELSNLLGDDGPEILAEQEALQSKLMELQQQKADMRNLVTQLQEVNSTAENTIKQRRQEPSNEVPRVVPVEYQRIVPIELVGASKSQQDAAAAVTTNGHDVASSNGHCNGSVDHDGIDDSASVSANQDDDAELVGETNEMIKQKMADIATMKNQLKRLKNMMDTVKLIEDKTDGRSIQEIASEAEHLLGGTVPVRHESSEKNQRNSVPRTMPGSVEEKDEAISAQESEMTEKVRILHEMTQDLRSQAASLASERDRLRSLRDEMIRRKEAENLEMATAKRDAPSPKDVETEQIKAEYETKKKEFEKLCERIHNNEEVVHDEEHTESVENIKHSSNSNAAFYQENWRNPNVVSSNSSGREGPGCDKQSTIPPTPSRGKDSTDSGAADIHGIASFEAGSMQSGSSRSFSMPPPMRTINARDATWRKNSQDNSQSQFEFYAPMPPPLPNWNPNYYYSTPYAQHFNAPHPHHHPVNPGSTDYFCSHNCHSSNVMNQSATSTSNLPPQTNQQCSLSTNDPVLLQQFIQTQQMLINSVCQCNQLLWHQQREIDNLNNAVLMLQERLMNTNIAEIATNKINRAESVPPTGVTTTNNVYTSHRAQSEQPAQPYQTIQQPLSSSSARHHHHQQLAHGYNYSNNFHIHRRNLNAMHQQQSSITSNSAAAYNYSTAEHASGVCTQLPPIVPHAPLNHPVDYNNVPHSPQTTNFLNNDIPPHSANIHQQHPATQPIYMHHHNNTMAPTDIGAMGAGNLPQQASAQQSVPPPPPPHHHTNNHSNLLTSQQQNCLNSPSTANASQSAVGSNSVSHGPNNAAAAAAASALNNQVPPGNRANNYWDNFRSYSRQNLLSTNSCKSNEEQQHHTGSTPFAVNVISNTTLNGSRNLHNAMNAINAMNTGNLASYSNNLTPPTFDNKYVYTFRNQFNSNIFNQHDSQPTPIVHSSSQQSSGTVMQNLQGSQDNYPINSTPSTSHNRQTAGILINQGTQSDNLNINCNNESNNINCNANANVAAIFGSSDFRNMNFNFGANELRKKISIKSGCPTKRIRHSQSMTNEMVSLNQGSNSSRISSSCLDEGGAEGYNEAGGAGASAMNVVNICLDFDNQEQVDNEFNDDDNVNADNSNASGYSESSEENKKNLLVNALRNDKFTSKFFERLKEDVYREVYSILQATESQPQYLEQLYKELQLVPTSDPIRNIVMQAMHDIYKRSSSTNVQSSGNYANNFSGANNATSMPFDNLNQATSHQSGSNQENELMNLLLNSTELRRLAYKIMFDSERSTSPVEKVGIKPNLSSSSASSSPKPPTEIYRPDYDLVDHIMTTIRSSIQLHRIDDDALMKIARLTITALERFSPYVANSTLQIDRIAISPKELYRRMKTFDRRDRETFLERYESFLQSMLVMKIVNDDANNLNVMAAKKASTSMANLLSNSAGGGCSETQNLRRNTFGIKSNIATNVVGLNSPESNCNRRVEHGEVATTDRAEAVNTNATKVQQSDFNQPQHQQQKNPPRNRRSKSNAPTNSLVLNQLLFSARSSQADDAARNNDSLSSPTINGNNITNEDLAEADQVCSSSTPTTQSTDAAAFGSSIKFVRNDPFRYQQLDSKTAGSKEHNTESDNNKNCDWTKTEPTQSEVVSVNPIKQEADSDSVRFSLDHRQSDVQFDAASIDVEVTTSNHSLGNGCDPQPSMNDAACALIYHETSSTASSTTSPTSDFECKVRKVEPSSSSSCPLGNRSGAKATSVSFNQQSSPPGSTTNSTNDGKPNNGVP